MTYPLMWDFTGFVLPLFIGVLAFLSGRLFHRWPKPCRAGIGVIAAGIVFVGGSLLLARALPPEIHRLLFRVGGATVLFSLVAVFLLGVVWAAPGRSIHAVVLALLITVAGSLLIIESSTRLWWRFCAPTAWQRLPDAQGRCVQLA